MKQVIQLKISLTNSKPLIWRKIQVAGDTTFFELHHIIQIVMGWQNYHLFEFNLEGYRIGEPDEEEKSNGYGSDQLMNAREVTLKDVITQARDNINYLYDFGDGWGHQIKVEKILTADAAIKYPICIDGKMNCPPEDCGGIASFYYFLEAVKDKKHPDYKDVIQCFGKKYDPALFDIEKVNRQLNKLEGYINKWLNQQ